MNSHCECCHCCGDSPNDSYDHDSDSAGVDSGGDGDDDDDDDAMMVTTITTISCIGHIFAVLVFQLYCQAC